MFTRQLNNYIIFRSFLTQTMLMLIFRGAVAGSNTPEATDRLAVLKDEITRLEDFEKVVDKHKAVRALLIWIPVKAILICQKIQQYLIQLFDSFIVG